MFVFVADVYGFGLIAIYLRTWPTLPYEFSNSVKSLQTSVGDESLFMLITDCLQYNPKNRIRKKDLGMCNLHNVLGPNHELL